MSTKIAIAYIISKYEVHRAPETPDKLKFGGKTVTLNPEGGVPLKFKKILIDAT